MKGTDGDRWAWVAGYEGLYLVSDHGRILSLQKRAPLLLRPGFSEKNPHPRVVLCKDGIPRTALVHRLVLEAFAGPCPPGMEGCHGDGDSGNNRLTNLRWDTPLANKHDALLHGTRARGERIGTGKLTAPDVREIRRQVGQGMSQGSVARLYGVDPSAVSRIVRHEVWAHVPDDEGGQP
jgi:hypothetical protein